MQKLKGNKTQTQDTTSGRSNPIKMVSEILCIMPSNGESNMELAWRKSAISGISEVAVCIDSEVIRFECVIDSTKYCHLSF